MSNVYFPTIDHRIQYYNIKSSAWSHSVICVQVIFGDKRVGFVSKSDLKASSSSSSDHDLSVGGSFWAGRRSRPVKSPYWPFSCSVSGTAEPSLQDKLLVPPCCC